MRADTLRSVIESVIGPLVARDGGAVEWVGLRGDVVELRLLGACRGCPGQRNTLEGVILPALRVSDPTVSEVRVLPSLVKVERARGGPRKASDDEAREV
ncbi:MAG: NifU family protein [Myxococcales bacterium]|nr:NifU family protein [Myxococcales bacterium]